MVRIRQVKFCCFGSLASRKNPRSHLLATALVIACGLQATAQDFPSSPALLLARGIVVERTTKGLQADAVGIRPGDVLLSWKRSDAQGHFESPFDLPYIWVEEASRGPVTITGRRNGNHRIWVLGPSSWGISARPNFTGRLLTMYSDGRGLAQSRKFSEFAGRFREAADAEQQQSSWLAPWLLSQAASTLAAAQRCDLFDDVLAEAIKYSEKAGSIVRAELFQQWADAYATRDDLEAAYKRSNQALIEWRRLGAKTVSQGNGLLSLAVLDLRRGDFDRAEDHLAQAKAIVEKLAPDGQQMVAIWGNLAVLHQDQGGLEQAEEDYLNALRKEERRFPGGNLHVQTLNDLGVLYDQRGDLTRAEAYLRKALAMSIRIDPESLDVADTLSSLAECVLEQGNAVRAESYQRRALSIREKRAPGSLDTAYSLAGVGKIARVRGDLTRAESTYQQALTIADRIGAPGRDRATFLMGLASVLRDRRDYSHAEELYRESLSIIEREDPGSVDRADILADLAGTIYHQHQVELAAQLYGQALDILERKAFQLGGRKENRSRYRAQHVQYYHEYMRVLLEQGQTERAFEVLEASHARTLLEMLSHSRLDVSQGADPRLLERERKVQQLINAKAEDRIRIGSGTAKTQPSVLDREVAELLLEQERVDTEIRESSPGYAALAQPQPLSSREIQSLLDDNTLLLEYSLGDEQSYVWAVTKTSLTVYQIPKRHEIEATARRVYALLSTLNREASKAVGSGNAAEQTYSREATTLSRMVLGPVAQVLGDKRLVIVSDGALEYIPFSALPLPEARTRSVPLVVKHEIVNLPSASVLAELRRERIGRPPASQAVAVLADPVFDTEDERLKVGRRQLTPSLGSLKRDAVTRAADDLGLTRNGKVSLNRLLYTRKEAEAVMSVTPRGQGMAALDFHASRVLATSPELGQFRIVHFATHGILDNKHPELSGLVLSLVNPRGQTQNGFLTLQDIYNLHLPADLVVLSGCETGLGEQINGEGLISLTRGFMYAGASRVVASLWSVSDIATANLMTEFYKEMLHDGMRPAAALRGAQVHMWRQKQWNLPYYWAAFQIEGEWQ